VNTAPNVHKRDNGQIMKCSEKEDLQHKWITAWNVYETAIKESGLSIDVRTGTIMPRSIREQKALARLIDPETMTLTQP